MKNLIIITILALVAAILPKEAAAQQDPQYSMYMFNGQVINPAYAGSRDALSVTALYRHQWTGLPGAPKTFTLSANGALLNDKIGLGGYIASDNLGVTNIITMAFDYNYRIKIKKGTLSLGMRAQFNQFQARFSELSTQDGGDGSFAQNSDNIFSPNFGFGAHYQNEFMYAGFSVPHLLNTSLNEKWQVEGTDAVARQYKHYFVTAGFIVPLSENIKLKPSALVKVVQNAPVGVDVNLSVLIKEQFWVGASYRVNYGVVGMVEYLFAKRFRLGYAYDWSHTELNQVTSGSHELMLGYEFRKGDSYLTPRRMSYF